MIKELDRLEHWERLEDVSERFQLPYLPEFDLATYASIYQPELSTLLQSLDAAVLERGSPLIYACRGRIRRLLGDAIGAAQDLQHALDEAPRLAQAHAWLGEIALGGEQSEASLTKAIALAPSLPWPYLYRGAGRLLRGERRIALSDIGRFCAAAPRSCLGNLIRGRLLESRDRGAALAAYQRAAVLAPQCSAAYLLAYRADPSAWETLENALDADPNYALITLSQFRGRGPWRAYLRRFAAFALHRAQDVPGFIRNRTFCSCMEERGRASAPHRDGFDLEDDHYSPYHLVAYRDAVAVCKRRPGRAWSWALLGRAALRCPPGIRRGQDGRAALQEAVRLAPKMGWIRAWRGLARIKSGQRRLALRDFDACIRMQPLYHRAYGWRGALLRKLGKPARALADFDRAILSDRHYAFLVHERSLALRALGDPVASAADLERAFRMDFRYNWAFTTGRSPSLTELDQAEAELARATRAHPRCASLLVWKAQVDIQRGRYSDALRELDRARVLDPHSGLAAAWRGFALLQLGRYRQARQALNDAASIEPRLWIARGWLAEADAAMGGVRKALASLERVEKEHPHMAWLRLLKGRLLLAADRPREAERAIAAALRIEGRHAGGHLAMAEAQVKQGRWRRAHDDVNRALTISPNLGRAYLVRALIRERLGRPAKAVKDYRVVLDRFPFLLNTQQQGSVLRALGSVAASAVR